MCVRTHDRWNVRKPRSKCVEDVFSAEVWLASSPLHEAGKTTKSGNTLKTGIGRGQLSFASDNPSSNPNACPLTSTFSKPHSEVASTTHTSAGIGRGQLSFASDNPSSNPNACPLISTFSKPHSEIASTTHTSALKRFRRDAQRFSTFIQPELYRICSNP